MATAPRTAGALFALGSGALTAAALLLGKAMLGQLPALALVTGVYSASTICFWVHAIATRQLRTMQVDRRALGPSVAIGLCDLVYNLSLFAALASMSSAAHGFSSLLSELVTVSMGVLFLAERYTLRETAAMATVLSGITIVQLNLAAAEYTGLAWLAVSALAAGTRTVVAKKALDARPPMEVGLVRTTIATLGLVLLSTMFGSLRAPPREVWLGVAAMGVVGPFLNTLSFYHALRSLPVGRVAMFRLIYVVLVPLGAWALLDQRIAPREVIGGTIVLVGCLWLAREKERATALTPIRSPR